MNKPRMVFDPLCPAQNGGHPDGHLRAGFCEGCGETYAECCEDHVACGPGPREDEVEKVKFKVGDRVRVKEFPRIIGPVVQVMPHTTRIQIDSSTVGYCHDDLELLPPPVKERLGKELDEDGEYIRLCACARGQSWDDEWCACTPEPEVNLCRGKGSQPLSDVDPHQASGNQPSPPTTHTPASNPVSDDLQRQKIRHEARCQGLTVNDDGIFDAQGNRFCNLCGHYVSLHAFDCCFSNEDCYCSKPAEEYYQRRDEALQAAHEKQSQPIAEAVTEEPAPMECGRCGVTVTGQHLCFPKEFKEPGKYRDYLVERDKLILKAHQKVNPGKDLTAQNPQADVDGTPFSPCRECGVGPGVRHKENCAEYRRRCAETSTHLPDGMPVSDGVLPDGRSRKVYPSWAFEQRMAALDEFIEGVRHCDRCDQLRRTCIDCRNRAIRGRKTRGGREEVIL